MIFDARQIYSNMIKNETLEARKLIVQLHLAPLNLSSPFLNLIYVADLQMKS